MFSPVISLLLLLLLILFLLENFSFAGHVRAVHPTNVKYIRIFSVVDKIRRSRWTNDVTMRSVSRNSFYLQYYVMFFLSLKLRKTRDQWFYYLHTQSHTEYASCGIRFFLVSIRMNYGMGKNQIFQKYKRNRMFSTSSYVCLCWCAVAQL